MSDLARRITEALDQAERLARAATPGPWEAKSEARHEAVSWHLEEIERFRGHLRNHVFLGEDGETARFIAANDPASVLRSVAADRRVLERHAPAEQVMYGSTPVLVCEHCESLCHSRSGLGCDSPDAPYPCADILDLADRLGVTRKDSTDE